MKKYFFASIFILGGVMLSGQRFKPYNAFGAQVNVNSNRFAHTFEGSTSIQPGPDFQDNSLRFDILACYDRGFMKWLGLSTGIGFSLRGGAKENVRRNVTYRRDLYYLNIPVRLQFKPWKFLWIEPGVEALYLLGHSDINFGNNSTGPFDENELNDFEVTAALALRFNLFRGLSLNLGYHRGLTPVAEIETGPGLPYSKTTYRDVGFHIGVRYMFGQP